MLCTNCQEHVIAWSAHWDSRKPGYFCELREPRDPSTIPVVPYVKPSDAPTIICDACLVEAEIELFGSGYDQRLIIKCHGVWKTMRLSSITKPQTSSKWKLLWSAIEHLFDDDVFTLRKRRDALTQMVKSIDELIQWRDIGVMQNAEPLKLPASMIDSICDLLMSLREDKR